MDLLNEVTFKKPRTETITYAGKTSSKTVSYIAYEETQTQEITANYSIDESQGFISNDN